MEKDFFEVILPDLIRKIDVIYEYVESVKAVNTKVRSKQVLSKEEASLIRKAKILQPRKKF